MREQLHTHHEPAVIIDTQLQAKIHEQKQQSQTPAFVNYVLSSGRNKGQIRPAVVVKDWGNSVNLIVFTDRLNDFSIGELGSDGMLWTTSVQYSDKHELNTWHRMIDVA